MFFFEIGGVNPVNIKGINSEIVIGFLIEKTKYSSVPNNRGLEINLFVLHRIFGYYIKNYSLFNKNIWKNSKINSRDYTVIRNTRVLELSSKNVITTIRLGSQVILNPHVNLFNNY